MKRDICSVFTDDAVEDIGSVKTNSTDEAVEDINSVETKSMYHYQMTHPSVVIESTYF